MLYFENGVIFTIIFSNSMILSIPHSEKNVLLVFYLVPFSFLNVNYIFTLIYTNQEDHFNPSWDHIKDMSVIFIVIQ